MTIKVSMGLAALGLGAALLTACGGDDGSGGDFEGQSADKIVERAKKDMEGLDSVRVAGSVSTGGQEIELDMQLNTDADCTGTLGFGGGTTELLGTGGSVWMKPDEAFWTSFAGDNAEQVMSLVADKWVVVPDGEDGFAELCDLDELLDELIAGDDDTTYSKTGDDEIDGDKVLAIESKDDEGTSTGYVLVDEPHYLVKVEKTEGDEPGSVTFSDFDESVDVQAPSDSEVVDLNSLG
ncbi:hypothetical protein KM427_02405 [Nocardioides sp. LMS-CY]|uniref:Lipoprotein n=1 Tax=Nocardioides soli TaxID=1036020 RepID=A0A7W4VVD3_9ACTN|nr:MULTISPECIES: hypothetical protein [Nocardioides]MBB3042476.1 hypothetical protein [Nocardioides soli]QWF22620.1 hypothetical protein KM427_02405 [Nocardioides sp. LMS-CY]